MKKILTTTLITAILATSGFAQDDKFEEYVYDTANFPSGTDQYPTTIMPSGSITVGSDNYFPVIASTWTLKEGSVMNVIGNGFVLQNELTINPNDIGAIPVQCNILNNKQLYYEYTYGRNKKKIYTSDNETYVDASGATVDKPTGTLNQTMTTTITGAPQGGGWIEMSHNGTALQGKICGGTVTYTPQGATILSKDGTSYDGSFPLSGKTKYTLSTAQSAGFQEEYLSNLPTLKYTCKTTKILKASNPSAYTDDQLKNSNTLQSYLNSFGFYPNTTTVLSGTGFNLLTSKDASAAIQLPKGTAFETDASETTYNITANLHNVDAKFDAALTFTGTGATAGTMDTLKFSGDNSNLMPECGVTYTDVNVTFDGEKSWIAAPKNQAVTFATTGSNSSTVTVCQDLEICSDLNIRDGVSIVAPKDTTIKLFGNLTFGDATFPDNTGAEYEKL